VLFRKKEAFSDGVSVKEKSWWQIIQEYLEDKIVLPEINESYPFYSTCLTKEAYYYYTKFIEEQSPFDETNYNMFYIIIGVNDTSTYSIKISATDTNGNSAQFIFPDFILAA
jgi:hypothetical protein